MKSIIIEGADGSGKSYLTRQLATDLDMILLTCGPPPRTYDEYMFWLKSQRLAIQTGGFILDRHSPMSSYAYYDVNTAQVSESTLTTHSIITSMINSPIYILCDTFKPHIDEGKTYKTKAYIDGVKKQIPIIKDRYSVLFRSMEIVPTLYDWEDGEYDKLLETLENETE